MREKGSRYPGGEERQGAKARGSANGGEEHQVPVFFLEIEV